MFSLDTLPFDVFVFPPIELICDANLLEVLILCTSALPHDVVDPHRLFFDAQAVVPHGVLPQQLCALILEESCDHPLTSFIAVLLTARLEILDVTFAYQALLCVASQSITINRVDAHAITYASLAVHGCVQAQLESPIFAFLSACDEGQLDGV